MKLILNYIQIARMIGNFEFNKIFEACMDKNQKLQPRNNM